MTPPKLDEPLFYYVIQIDDREFPLVIMPDGISQWDEHTERLRIRDSRHRDLELRAFAGDRYALQQLQNELSEFTISIAAPETIFAKAQEMAQKQSKDETVDEEFHSATWEEANDIAEMDRLLEDFFWREVNPWLKQPLAHRRK